MQDETPSVVGAADVDSAVETVALAFRHDPVWGVALSAPDGRDDHLVPYWRIYVESALRYGTLFGGEGMRTVSVWIPPGGDEITSDEETQARALAVEALGSSRAQALFELWERLDHAHPRDEPHAYLSLLATHPDHAGHRYGQRHLAADLARWDALGTPTYLESSNPANDVRYARAGFQATGSFTAVLNEAPLTTMWRPVGG